MCLDTQLHPVLIFSRRRSLSNGSDAPADYLPSSEPLYRVYNWLGEPQICCTLCDQVEEALFWPGIVARFSIVTL
jgi:hypothetical protein